MRRVLITLQVLTLVVAAALAAAPLSQGTVERYYADWFYPALQARLTSWSNETVLPFHFAVFFSNLRDRRAALTICGAIRAPSIGVAAVARGAGDRDRLRSRISVVRDRVGPQLRARAAEVGIGYDPGRVTDLAVRTLAERAVLETNNGYASAHASGFPARGEVPPSLVVAFHEVERRLGRPRPTVPGRPKRTLLSPFFRASGDERDACPISPGDAAQSRFDARGTTGGAGARVGASAGYAPEDDASFVGLVAAMYADPGSRYSAWLALTFEAANQLPRRDREHVLSGLAAGPRLDEQAIAARLQSRIETVQQVSWQTYDRYLKSQGVAEGIRSYSRVVQLLVGSGAIDW